MSDDIRVIEYHMLNKERYIPSAFASTLCIRGLIYPSMLVKTRLQIQTCNSVYSGTLDAFRKIVKSEGFTGLYRGFWISSVQLFPITLYFMTYESTKHVLDSQLGVKNNTIKLATSGCVASVVCQIFLVPVELIMQHLMLIGHGGNIGGSENSTTNKTATAISTTTTTNNNNNNINYNKYTQVPSHARVASSNYNININTASINTINSSSVNHRSYPLSSTSSSSSSSTSSSHKPMLARHVMLNTDQHSRWGPIKAVIRGMYQQSGPRGFYQGFWSSLFCHGPYNALIWVFYDRLSYTLTYLLPDSTSRLVIVSLAAPLGGMVTAFITNPLDVLRARIQIDGTKLKESTKILWREERWRFLTKGASARVVALTVHSFFTFLGYETIKRWSVLEEYRDDIRW